MNLAILSCLIIQATFCLHVAHSQSFSFLDATRSTLMSYSVAKTPAPSTPGEGWFPSISVPSTSISGHVITAPASTRRRRTSTRRRRTVLRPRPKPVPKRPHNKFIQAVDEIEKAVSKAAGTGNRLRPTTTKLAKLKNYIRLAVKKRGYKFARQALGFGIYSSMKLKTSGAIGKRSSASSAKSFTEMVKKQLSTKEFEKFLSVRGEVTLGFAIDDTGSMWGEIGAAKSIATSIVNHPRPEPVDFVLSPFNDPGTGPVVYKDETQKTAFVKAISNLRAHAGGDCPELTFKGMLDAIDRMQEGSPLYVFTDATAKDATKENMEDLLTLAREMKITINFFTTGLCGRSYYKPFETLAAETCGSMFRLPSSGELSKLTSLTKRSLGGLACVSPSDEEETNSGKKRSITSQYAIPIDDTVDDLTITVTTENPGPTIRLYDPRGSTVRSPRKTTLQRGAIYNLKNPLKGRWRLLVSRNAGKHKYVVMATSRANIDFDYMFVMPQSRGKPPIAGISHPLLGQKAHAIIMLARADAVSKSTLRLNIVNKHGRHLSTATLTPKGTSGAHFYATFNPPTVPFRFLLKGVTKKGYTFKRYSRGTIQAKTALLYVTYSQNFFTVPANPRKRSSAILTLRNTGPKDRFLIKVKDRLGCTIRHRRAVRVRRGQSKKFVVSFRARAHLRGKTDQVFVTAKGQKSGVSTKTLMTMFIV